MTIPAKATTFTFGTAANDLIFAQYEFGDMIDALAGDDTVYGLNSSDLLLGNAGRDQIFGLGGNDTLDGGAGNDRLQGDSGDDVLRPDTGAIGNDTIDGGEGLDTVDYSVAPVKSGVRVDLRVTNIQDTRGGGKELILNVENVTGSNLADVINGNASSNSLAGGNGNDTVYGQDGNDSVDGGAANDYLYGGNGNDFLRPDRGAAGNDFVDGGAGIDTLDFQNSGVLSGVIVNLGVTVAQNTGGAGRDTIRNIEQVSGSVLGDTITGNALDNWINGNQGSDSIVGGDGNDQLFAGGGDFGTSNTLFGGNGDDKLTGGSGNDTLDGGAGIDRLMGNTGADVLSGGTGADLFYFTTPDSAVSTPDTIVDYNGLEDSIVIQSTQFVGPISFIGSDVFTATGHTEVRVTETGGVQLIEIDLEGNGSADVDMAIRVIGTTITASDLSFVNSFIF